ncbi:hypothetical protein, partial [Niallia sp. 03091]|uniref:hypothetical protein n=1 Tax=Niallia sp. 03091 TaxID=3458059 RepID=UPI004043AE24
SILNETGISGLHSKRLFRFFLIKLLEFLLKNRTVFLFFMKNFKPSIKITRNALIKHWNR